MLHLLLILFHSVSNPHFQNSFFLMLSRSTIISTGSVYYFYFIVFVYFVFFFYTPTYFFPMQFPLIYNLLKCYLIQIGASKLAVVWNNFPRYTVAFGFNVGILNICKVKWTFVAENDSSIGIPFRHHELAFWIIAYPHKFSFKPINFPAGNCLQHSLAFVWTGQ